MTEVRKLGRIKRAVFGFGGYQDCCIGLRIELGGEDWDTGDFKGATVVKWHDGCSWTENERLRSLGDACLLISDLLRAAHVLAVEDLAGTPVEVTFAGNKLASWRVLTEVLS